MGKVKVTQIPRQLNPYGDKLMKVWYDDDMPPKNYIWYKDEEYLYWNGQTWEPFEFGDTKIDNKHKHDKCCCNCCENAKFEKFKKDVLAAVLKLIKSQDSDGIAALAERVMALESDVNSLKQINHDLFIKNTELEIMLQDMGYIKESDLAESEEISGLNEKFRSVNNRITDLSSRIEALENGNYITEDDLTEYASINYVNNAISGINIPTKLSDLENDCGFISDVEIDKHEYDQPNIISSENAVYLLDDVQYDGINKVIVSISPYKIAESEPLEPYDDTELRNNIADITGDVDGLDGRVSAIEGNYVTSEQGDAITTAIGDLNGNVSDIENSVSKLEEGIYDNELVISAAFNDLNDRMLAVEEKQ